MKLQDIGFYTLSDERAKTTSSTSPISRLEMIITDRCNFKCAYCRGLKDDQKGHLNTDFAFHVINECSKPCLKNIRLSGGEPMSHPQIHELIQYARLSTNEHVAISTNGSYSIDRYIKAVENGVNDFSISLDACCDSMGDGISGVPGSFYTIKNNIKILSTMVYVTVGVVLNKKNEHELENIIMFADSLQVSDIRIISEAAYNKLPDTFNISEEILSKYPLLNYRIKHLREGRNVRGIGPTDNHKCPLVLDDMAIVQNKHYPCIIYMREHGDPIGEFTTIEEVREQRTNWYKTHNCYTDPICSKNCLDVCIDYNNKVNQLQGDIK